jgi:mRNA-degrading endonuclease RelE of RelBE toxin-antitoxin system
MYSVELHRQAAKYYDKLDAKAQRRINNAVDVMAKNPHEGQHIKKLKGRLEGKYRYDTDGLRIIYFVDEPDKTVFIEAIGPRGDIYK